MTHTLLVVLHLPQKEKTKRVFSREFSLENTGNFVPTPIGARPPKPTAWPRRRAAPRKRRRAAELLLEAPRSALHAMRVESTSLGEDPGQNPGIEGAQEVKHNQK